MESRLQELVTANQPANRFRWALRWREDKGKVIGIIGSNIPEEIAFAAGMLPWGVSGTWDATTPLASAFRPDMSCRFCTHVLESVLNGELDFLDGYITTPRDDAFKSLWTTLEYLGKPSHRLRRLNHAMYLPHNNTKTTLLGWTESVKKLAQEIEIVRDLRIKDEELVRAIDIYNTTRQLLKEVYELRKADAPALTGAEVLGITTASRVMPKDEFNRRLNEIMPYLKTRKAPLKKLRPRLLVSSDYLDNPAYVQLVESVGAVVGMDDLDTGSRYLGRKVDLQYYPVYEALAKTYLEISSPRMSNWKEQLDQIVNWVKEYKIDGIVELRQLYSYPREFMFNYTVKRLKEEGIPHLPLRREYHYADVGRLTTRVEAFAEMLRNRGA